MKISNSILCCLLCMSIFAQIDHSIFTEVLQQHVSKDGFVDYESIKKQPEKLNIYLRQLSTNPPTSDWTSNEKKAYWINAYNAYTIKLIIDNYPVKSIKDIGGSIYKVNTPWDIKFIKIGDKTYDLNNIEHSILRKDFNDPRIHFAINCASISCPNIRNEAYTESSIETQLEDQASQFINDKTKNILDADKAILSKIFQWFTSDFTKTSSLITFINKYASVKLSEETKIDYLDYNWNLNNRKN